MCDSLHNASADESWSEGGFMTVDEDAGVRDREAETWAPKRQAAQRQDMARKILRHERDLSIAPRLRLDARLALHRHNMLS